MGVAFLHFALLSEGVNVKYQELIRIRQTKRTVVSKSLSILFQIHPSTPLTMLMTTGFFLWMCGLLITIMDLSAGQQEPFQIVLNSTHQSGQQIGGKTNDDGGLNGFSPFNSLTPQIWIFNAFVGTRQNPHERGQLISFSLEVDSGDTWIKRQAYDGSSSPSFAEDQSKVFGPQDLFGQVTGYAASDNMNLLGYDFNFTGQPFGLITDFSAYRSPYSYWADGKLGLAWSKKADGDSALDTSLLPALTPLKRFTISFDQFDSQISYALFGDVDCDNCLDDWATVSTAGSPIYWQFNLQALRIAADQQMPIAEADRLTMLSTRLPFIYGPSSYIRELAISFLGATQQNDDQGRTWYEVECSKMAELPDVSLKLGKGQFLALSTKEYVYKASNHHCILLFAHIDAVRTEHYAHNVEWVLGLPVLRRYCQLYDIENGEIGFGQTLAIGQQLINS